MIPYISLKDKILCWFLWRINGYNKMDEKTLENEIYHQELSYISSLMRIYHHYKNNK